MPRVYCTLLGRQDLPERSEFAQLRPALRLLIIALAGWVGLVTILTALAMSWLEPNITGRPELLGARTSSAAPFKTARSARFDNIVDHPLFSRTRKPATLVESVAGPSSPDRVIRDHNITLKGVFIRGATIKAFVTSTQSPFGTWVALDDDVGGWRVAGVTPDQMVLNANDEKVIVPLSFGGSSHRGQIAVKDAQSRQPIYGPRQNPKSAPAPDLVAFSR
jgi:hypothetical protein